MDKERNRRQAAPSDGRSAERLGRADRSDAEPHLENETASRVRSRAAISGESNYVPHTVTNSPWRSSRRAGTSLAATIGTADEDARGRQVEPAARASNVL